MERTLLLKKQNKIVPKTNKKTPSNSMGFTPIHLKQNTGPHYLTSLNPEQKVKTNENALNNLIYSQSKKRMNNIRNTGKNIIRSITPNQSNKNLIDNNNNNYNNPQTYLREISPLPDIYLNQYKSYLSQKENYEKEMPKQLQIVFSLKKKLVEVNKILENKNKEIEDLKRDLAIFNINELKNQNNDLKKENKKLKEVLIDDNVLNDNLLSDKNNINELQNEINMLKKEKELINKKYKDELDKNKSLNNKINNLNKNNNNIIKPNEETQKLLNQISYQEKIIDQLQDEVLKTNNEKQKSKIIKSKFENYELKIFNYELQINSNLKNNLNNINNDIKPDNNKKINKLRQLVTDNFTILGNEKKSNFLNNEENKYNKLELFRFFLTLKNDITEKNHYDLIKFLNEEEFKDIELLINIIHKILKYNEKEIKIFDVEKDLFIIIKNFCDLFKIKDDAIIERFLLKISLTKEGFSINKMKENFFLIFNKAQIGINVQKMKNFIPELIQNCRNFDFKNDGFIPYYFFKNIYSQICFREKINLIPEEFNLFLSIMKKNNTNENISIYLLNYLNLQDYLNTLEIPKKNIIYTEKKNENDNKEKTKLKNKKKNNKIENNSKLNSEKKDINKIKSFDNELNKINEKKENAKITKDFLDRVLKGAHERYKEKMSLKKNHSQNEIIYIKYG